MKHSFGCLVQETFYNKIPMSFTSSSFLYSESIIINLTHFSFVLRHLCSQVKLACYHSDDCTVLIHPSEFVKGPPSQLLFSGAQARKGHQWSTMGDIMGKIFWEIYPCEKFWLWRHVRLSAVRPYRLSGWWWGGKRAPGDGSVRAIFLGGKLRGSIAFGNARFSGGKWYDQQRDKEQESGRKAKEHERRGEEIWEI